MVSISYHLPGIGFLYSSRFITAKMPHGRSEDSKVTEKTRTAEQVQGRVIRCEGKTLSMSTATTDTTDEGIRTARSLEGTECTGRARLEGVWRLGDRASERRASPQAGR